MNVSACIRKRAAAILLLTYGLLLPQLSDAAESANVEFENDAVIELTLEHAVERSLERNPTLVNSRMGRILAKYDFTQAKRHFRPDVSFGTMDFTYNVDELSDFESYRLAAGPRLLMRLPSGGSVVVSPNWSARENNTSASSRRDLAGLGVSLYQPLLRGGGFSVGLAPVRLARLSEERSLLNFKRSLSDVITSVIRAYRLLIQAKLSLDIAERALERSRETLEVNKLLISTGRMSQQDQTQSEANVALQELAVLRSADFLDDVQRDMRVLLDLDSSSTVVPIDDLVIPPAEFDIDESLTIARENHPDFLVAKLNLDSAEIIQTLADNNAQWDLTLVAGANFTGTGMSFDSSFDRLGANIDGGRYSVGLALTIPLNDSNSDQSRRSRLSAKVSRKQAEFTLASAERSMETEVRNAVRNVVAGANEVELAAKALELAEQKLEIEQEKLQLGLSSNYQLVIFQEDLVNAQVSELRARINYLNALSQLDLTLGTVLNTWGVDLETVSAAPVGFDE